MEYVDTIYAPAAIGPYSQAVIMGELIFCSGQIALLKDGTMADSDIVVQTRQVLENLAKILEAAGSSLEMVVKTTVFLKNINDFGAMNEVYSEYFSAGKPARSTIEAANLPKNALIEIECIAMANEKK